MKSSEFQIIERIKKIIPRRLQGPIGMGDDAGVIHTGRTCLAGRRAHGFAPPLLFTTDSIVEGVDFIYGKLAPERVGRKALAVNLSDIAAMGGKPTACVVSLGIPKILKESWIEKFYKGMISLAKKYGVLCVGGDLSKSRQFFASVALLGAASDKKIIKRSGARPGDWIGVTGTLGGSIHKKHWAFEPRLREGEFLARYFTPTAMIDISDGFVQDLKHILKASKVGARIELDKIPVDISSSLKLKNSSVHALADGEDFELLFTLPARKKEKLQKAWKRRFPSVKLSWVGRIVKRDLQYFWRGKKLKNFKLKKEGYVHF